MAVLIGMITSIFTYMVVKDTPVFWPLIGVELLGVLVGSFIGPRTSKYIPEKWLKILFIVLAVYVGIRYTTKGFLGHSIVPPFPFSASSNRALAVLAWGPPWTS